MSKPNLKIGFAGTPEFAAAHLKALIEAEFSVEVVLSQPDRPAGRGKKLMASPVKDLALEHRLPILQPETLKGADTQALLRDYQLDVLVVVAYGLLLPQAVLDIPRLGCINVHASLLPKWRGAAPVQRAIEAGDSETGVCIMQMEAGLDTGPILYSDICDIRPTTTAGTLFTDLESVGPKALIHTLEHLEALQSSAVPQDHAASSYARKISKEEAFLDFTESAIEVDRKIRAFHPFPVAFTSAANERIRVHAASPMISDNKHPAGTVLAIDKSGILVQCGSGAIRLEQVQLPNAKTLMVSEVLNNPKQPFRVGIVLGRPFTA